MTVPASLSSVPDVAPYIQYVATSGQTVYPYPFPITEDSDLVVVINGVTQSTDTGYSVSGVGDSTGGDVTLDTGSTAGDIITLYRDIPIERISQIAQNSGFSSTVFNNEFNNFYLIAQQLEASLAQCLQIPNTNSPAPTTSLTPAVYAGKYLSFDSYGNPQATALTSSGDVTATLVGTLISPQTAAEITAGVTPSSYYYPPGDIRRYGTNVGTGNDDTAAINTAVSIVQTCVVPSGITLLSGGNHTPVAGCIVIGPGTIKLSGGTNALFSVAASGVYFRNLTVDCSSNTSTSKVGFSFAGTTSDLEVSDCVLTAARILTAGTNTNVRIRRNRCYGTCVGGVSGATINIASSGTTSEFSVTDNRVESSDGSGIGVFNFADHGIISGNICLSNTGVGILLQSGQIMTVSGNICEGNNETGIGFQPAAITDASQRVAITGNICRGNSYDGFDINVDASAVNYVYLEVVGNHAENNGTNATGGTGFYLKYASSCSVVGNTALGNNTDGIQCEGGTLLTLQGNVCTANGSGSSGTYNGITLNGVTYASVMGNICTNTSGGANQAYGIAEQGSADGNMIIGNNCPNNSIGAVLVVGANTVAVPNGGGGRLNQSFTIAITNASGTMQHAMYAQPGAASVGDFMAKITGASSAATNTPAGADSTTAFAAGGKIGSANTNYFWLNTADQLTVLRADLAGAVCLNSSGTALTVEVVFASLDINGVTATRPALAFYNATSGAAFALTTANIASGDTIEIQLRGSLL